MRKQKLDLESKVAAAETRGHYLTRLPCSYFKLRCLNCLRTCSKSTVGDWVKQPSCSCVFGNFGELKGGKNLEFLQSAHDGWDPFDEEFLEGPPDFDQAPLEFVGDEHDSEDDPFGWSGLGFNDSGNGPAAVDTSVDPEPSAPAAHAGLEVEAGFQQVVAPPSTSVSGESGEADKNRSMSCVVGSRVLHASHVLAHYGGAIWCWRCGCWSSTVPRGLGKPCAGTPKRAGAQTLGRIRRGLTPHANFTWSRTHESYLAIKHCFPL